MVRLLEAQPNTVCKVSGWTEIIVRAFLEGMGEFDDEETSGLEVWLKEDVSYLFSSLFFFFFFLKLTIFLFLISLQ